MFRILSGLPIRTVSQLKTKHRTVNCWRTQLRAEATHSESCLRLLTKPGTWLSLAWNTPVAQIKLWSQQLQEQGSQACLNTCTVNSGIDSRRPTDLPFKRQTLGPMEEYLSREIRNLTISEHEKWKARDGSTGCMSSGLSTGEWECGSVSTSSHQSGQPLFLL